MSSLPTFQLALESTDQQALLQYLYNSPQQVAPPTSDPVGYYPVDVKSEYAPSMSSENNNMLSTPMHMLQLQDHKINFNFNYVLGTSIPQSGTSFGSSNLHALQQHHPLHDSITAGSPSMALSPPLNLTPSYTFSQDYKAYPPCRLQMTGSHPLDCNFYSIFEPSAMHLYIDSSWDNAHSSVLRNNVKRNFYIDNAQRRGTPFQKFHGRGEVKENISDEHIPVSKIPKAMHVCDFPGCEKQTAFKRREHLRRHQNTKHGLGVKLECKSCLRQFNRRDNLRQHLKRHTETNRPGARTHYNEEAVQQYEKERSNTKRRRPPVK